MIVPSPGKGDRDCSRRERATEGSSLEREGEGITRPEGTAGFPVTESARTYL